ncbi:hypothetical protein M422DRAFT_257063 [Sphaerobolus stellatus SS14]|uniref:Zn(2)-C6 fungal-type domain-containing protein n=1 Tax=Sphaerobolus stellatus (strain SS14) TaxID=990650 RepID=A0A0C9VQ63_SPHS4|nr:hypothetical protein M422DRAFT_257063 [Sphaerobolus stellatus SS14]
MTDLVLPAHMLAWKTLGEVERMEDVPAGNARRTVQGFQADEKFNWPALTFSFDNPKEEEEDRGTLLEGSGCLAEEVEDAAQVLKKAQEEEKAKEKEKEKEKEKGKEKEKEKGKEKEKEKGKEKEKEKGKEKKKEKGKEKEKEKGKEKKKEKGKEKEKQMGPSGSAKGKAKEVPKTPKNPTPKKSKCDVHSESEEEEEEEDDDNKPQSCIYCVKKKIPCVPQNGKKVCVACTRCKMRCEFFDKTTWAIMEGSEKVAEAVWEMTKLERHRTASLLEKSWYDLDICALNLEQTVDRDLMEADGKVLTLLDLKSRGVEILPEVEKRIMTNRESIVVSYTTHMEHIFTRMNLIQKRMGWTKNGLPDSTLGESVAGPSSRV